MREFTRQLKDEALRIGFHMVGVATAAPTMFYEEYNEWLAQGMHGTMDYLARNLEKRLDSRLLLDGTARSVVMVGVNYYSDLQEGPATPVGAPGIGVIARYARGDDYHDVVLAALRELERWVRERHPSANSRCYVDTGPLLERETAQRAGLGWVGKHTLLINQDWGSYFFLGALVTSLELEPDQQAQEHCGTCTRCIDACPTGAITAPYMLDARRCLSYLTIEQKDIIPSGYLEAVSALPSRIFGCDICQEVCPFTKRFSRPTTWPEFTSRLQSGTMQLIAILDCFQDEFREQFRGSAVKRAKLRGLQRNATAAMYGSSEPGTEEILQRTAVAHDEDVVRRQAATVLSAGHEAE